jgi:succinate dehydrogenase / fumarate reductase, flavoprotein subunit
MSLEAEVVVVGSGAAGLSAALAAHEAGADVLLLDKSLVGRGGATVMAQMTVAAALGHAEEDAPEIHLADTIAAGRGLVRPHLAAPLCEIGPGAVLQSGRRGVRWAADGHRLRQVSAPGHSRRRCVYVDVLATGRSLSRALRGTVHHAGIRTLENAFVTDLHQHPDGSVAGCTFLDTRGGEAVDVWAPTIVLAGGGCTELFARNSASANMTGDAYSLALRAGAALADVEMVQFFPIANLAPKLIGLDPILWYPFRYKLGGRLLNDDGEEFLHRYTPDVAENGGYITPRDVLSAAILAEVAAGRGSPSGGAWLDFREVDPEAIRDAFPSAVTRLVDQGINLAERAIEVAPTAHYTIGGIACDGALRTDVPGLFAAGEAVGGAHGANRLSGNAITEALVFGELAGRRAADEARGTRPVALPEAGARAAERVDRLRRGPHGDRTASAVRREIQQVMQEHVGPVRDEVGLRTAQVRLADLREEVGSMVAPPQRAYNLELVQRLELEFLLDVADAVAFGAMGRRESRGAHRRIDHPDADPTAEQGRLVRLNDAGLSWSLDPAPVAGGGA